MKKKRETLDLIEQYADGTDLLVENPLLFEQITDPDQQNSLRLMELLLGVASNRYDTMSLSQLFEDAKRRGLFAAKPYVFFKADEGNADKQCWFRLRYARYVTMDGNTLALTNASSKRADILRTAHPTFSGDIERAIDLSNRFPYAAQAIFSAYFLDAAFPVEDAFEQSSLYRGPLVHFVRMNNYDKFNFHKVDLRHELTWDPTSPDDASWLRQVNKKTRVYVSCDHIYVEHCSEEGRVNRWVTDEVKLPSDCDTRLFMFYILMLLWIIGIKPSKDFMEECFKKEKLI